MTEGITVVFLEDDPGMQSYLEVILQKGLRSEDRFIITDNVHELLKQNTADIYFLGLSCQQVLYNYSLQLPNLIRENCPAPNFTVYFTARPFHDVQDLLNQYDAYLQKPFAEESFLEMVRYARDCVLEFRNEQQIQMDYKEEFGGLKDEKKQISPDVCN